jgi:hypothetical protein
MLEMQETKKAFEQVTSERDGLKAQNTELM